MNTQRPLSANPRLLVAMEGFEFKDPLWLGAGLLVLLMLLRQWRLPRTRLTLASLSGYRPLQQQSHPLWTQVPLWLRVLALVLITIALARPRQGLEQTRVREEGVDIVLAIDVSGSMLAEDFEVDGRYVNRLESVKHVVRDFIKERVNDRVGIVIFAGAAYIQAPPTLDHRWLTEQWDHLFVGMLGEDGTAIGTALGTALNRLRASDAKSRLIVLLTDGENNAGELTPDAAADLASEFGVKLYTVGVGSKGWARMPVDTPFGRQYQRVRTDIDDAGLTRIAEMTGGRYFRATDTESLRAVYAEIDRLERVSRDSPTFMVYYEGYSPWLLAALVCLTLEFVLGQTVLRVLP